MNALYLSIISILCISVTVLITPAYGIPYVSPPGKYFNSDIVLIGKVISSVPFSSDYTKYEIQVEQYLKNPQSQDIMTVIAPGTNKTGLGMTGDTIFDVGQRAFLYLKQDQGNNVAWWYSYPAKSLCDPAPTAADMNSTHVKGAGLDYDPLHVGASKSNSYLYAPNQPVIISYDAWNNQFTKKTFDVVFQVKNQTGQILFNDTKQVELKPCIGHQMVNSTFIPKVAGTYDVDVIFDNSLTGTTVEIPSLAGTSSGILHASPLKQFKMGIQPNEVLCQEGLQLIFKSEDNLPVCVKADTAFHLTALGWGYLPSPFITKTDLLNSKISGGMIKEFQYDLQSASIIIKIQTTSDGSLMVTIPKFITDLGLSHKPFKDFHTVLVDGMEKNIDLVPTANGSSFTIPFANGTQEIEIIGNQVGQQS